MDVRTLEGAGHPLPCGHHRGGVRLLCRYGTAGSPMVAGAFAGMALSAGEGAEAHVAEIGCKGTTFLSLIARMAQKF